MPKATENLFRDYVAPFTELSYEEACEKLSGQQFTSVKRAMNALIRATKN